ncbi:hypothetical protein PG995_009081 [Apiospora arundinis]
MDNPASVKAAERPSLKRQADFDSSDNKRSKIDLPNRSASAFSHPRQLRGASPRKPQTHANSDDEDVDEGADHRGAHNSQLVSPPAPAIEAIGPTRRPCLGRSSLDDENFEVFAEELAENSAEVPVEELVGNPAEKSEAEEDT